MSRQKGDGRTTWARIWWELCGSRSMRQPARAYARHAEMLNPDGTIYTTNLRSAVSIDTYVTRGGGLETWQPKFTFHGFRYVELTGVPEKPRSARSQAS